MTFVLGRINRRRSWRLRALVAASIAGFATMLPFWMAQAIGGGGDAPTDTTTFVFVGFIAGVPALIGFFLGRYWLPYLALLFLIYGINVPGLLRGDRSQMMDAGIGLMACVAGAGVMSFLSDWWKLRVSTSPPV